MNGSDDTAANKSAIAQVQKRILSIRSTLSGEEQRQQEKHRPPTKEREDLPPGQ
jgi:hypothetical protein